MGASNCRYDACVEVPADYIPIADAKKTVIPGGLYAVSRFEGAVSEIESFWTSLITDWLPLSDYSIDERPSFEHFLPQPKTGGDARVFRCDVCIPVVPD